MPRLRETTPVSLVEPVTEVLHGVAVTDPYRWLEDQDSQRTRQWIAAQTSYSRGYLDSISGRERSRDRIRQLVDIETYDSLQQVGTRYFFRKRLCGKEQPCICLREGRDGPDEILVDPESQGTGPYTAARPLRVSADGRLLLYEVKHGGERTATFHLLDIEKRAMLPDALPRGYLHGFAFAPDSRSFYYVHEPLNPRSSQRHVVSTHVLGTRFADDEEIYCAGNGKHLRLHIISGTTHLGFFVVRFQDTTRTDFYLWPINGAGAPEPLIQNAS
jgi:prolyl oligopeptidase